MIVVGFTCSNGLRILDKAKKKDGDDVVENGAKSAGVSKKKGKKGNERVPIC